MEKEFKDFYNDIRSTCIEHLKSGNFSIDDAIMALELCKHNLSVRISEAFVIDQLNKAGIHTFCECGSCKVERGEHLKIVEEDETNE